MSEETVPLTQKQREAIAEGKPFPGYCNFKKLPPDEQELLRRFINGGGKPLPEATE